MKTIEIKLYKFNELNREAQETAIDKLSDINVSYDWWDTTYEDAKNVLLEIDSFDLDPNRHAKGSFLSSGLDSAYKIIKDHGKDCDTYKTAENFIKQYETMFAKYANKEKPNLVAEGNEYDFDNDLTEIEEQFLKDILEDYANLLQNDFDYFKSDQSIINTIQMNDYDFTEEGELY